jgi:hypothetical protein
VTPDNLTFGDRIVDSEFEEESYIDIFTGETVMKKSVLILLAILGLTLTGCGGDHYEYLAPLYSTQILSDASNDGDIAKPVNNTSVTITQGTAQSYYAGFDPADGAEFRAFLQFRLAGAGGVPGNAVIQSATLDILINSIQPNPLLTTIPIRIDLVDLDPPTLVANDFSRSLQPALATTTIYPPIAQTDFGQHVFVDVTSLMQEAQRLGLPVFQVRILVDPGASLSGLIEINDSTGINRGTLAPLLDVSYF